jgi:tRNA G18 (ribose-2'-O)-methylase SpoU
MQRGYFGIGIEGVSKPVNFGNLARTAHGFGASFVFTVAPARVIGKPGTDTNRSDAHLPWYTYPSVAGMHLPDDCRVVGIELTEDAIDLPSFRHPTRAAYVLGPESGSLSPEMTQCCEFVVKIPIRYCINVATAGAIVMYDRMLSLGKFAERPVKSGAPLIPIRQHVHGKPLYSGGIRMPGRKGRDRQPKP